MRDWVGDEDWWDSQLLSRCHSKVEAGDYVSAVREAFAVVDTRLQQIPGLPQRKPLFGKTLIETVFDDTKTPFAVRVRRQGKTPTEGKARVVAGCRFTQGAYVLYRNPTTHELVDSQLEPCVSVLQIANLILHLIGEGRATVESLRYALRDPTQEIRPEDELKELMETDSGLLPGLLPEVLVLRSDCMQRTDDDGVAVIDNYLDKQLPACRKNLGRQQDRQGIWTECKNELLELLRGQDTEAQISSARHLQYFGGREVVEALCEVVSHWTDHGAEVVSEAIRSLAVLPDPKGRTAITSLLEGAGAATVRSDAIEALSEMGHDPESVRALVAVLQKEIGWPDKVRAIRALGNLRALEALEELHVCLASDHWSIQIEACKVLGTFLVESSVEPISELLIERARNQDVKLACVAALGGFKTDTASIILTECQQQEATKDPAAKKPENRPDQRLLCAIGDALGRMMVSPQ